MCLHSEDIPASQDLCPLLDDVGGCKFVRRVKNDFIGECYSDTLEHFLQYWHGTMPLCADGEKCHNFRRTLRANDEIIDKMHNALYAHPIRSFPQKYANQPYSRNTFITDNFGGGLSSVAAAGIG